MFALCLSHWMTHSLQHKGCIVFLVLIPVCKCQGMLSAQAFGRTCWHCITWTCALLKWMTCMLLKRMTCMLSKWMTCMLSKWMTCMLSKWMTCMLSKWMICVIEVNEMYVIKMKDMHIIEVNDMYVIEENDMCVIEVNGALETHETKPCLKITLGHNLVLSCSSSLFHLGQQDWLRQHFLSFRLHLKFPFTDH